MVRRVVSLTLLLALLLTQWVNAHRRYDGCATHGRPPAPHVHLSELVPFKVAPKVESPEYALDADVPRTWLAASHHSSAVGTTRPLPGCWSAPLSPLNRVLLI